MLFHFIILIMICLYWERGIRLKLLPVFSLIHICMYTLINCDIVSYILNPNLAVWAGHRTGGQLFLLLTSSWIWPFYFLSVKGRVSVREVLTLWPWSNERIESSPVNNSPCARGAVGRLELAPFGCKGVGMNICSPEPTPGDHSHILPALPQDVSAGAALTGFSLMLMTLESFLTGISSIKGGL